MAMIPPSFLTVHVASKATATAAAAKIPHLLLAVTRCQNCYTIIVITWPKAVKLWDRSCEVLVEAVSDGQNTVKL